ncbi:MAG: M48 family metalloprotease [Ignavibacteriae bacterium]|nr:M48 family metalloprotease [Ignavibacteriota bacterium]
MKKSIIYLRNRFIIINTLLLISALLSLSIFYSCGANLFSEDDDIKLGKEIDDEIKAHPTEYPMLQGHQDIKDYVNGLGKYILETSPKIEYKKVFPYNFQVVNDTIINAFCTPGGYIYVYTGLMKFIDNEATLAGIVAHEIAHAERRHMTQRLTSYYGVSLIFSIVLGNNPNSVAEIVANLFAGLGFLANSRADEEEADNYSIKYLMTSRYYPGAITFFFDKISEEQRRKGDTPGGLDRLLSTHPLPQDRIDNVKLQLKNFKVKPDPTKGLYTEDYQQIKSKLP